MELSPGSRLRSQVCATEVIVVRTSTVDLTCGGHSMIPLSQTPADSAVANPTLSAGNQLGKRYTDSCGELEGLVTKAGDGTLADGDEPLQLTQAKPLPSSD